MADERANAFTMYYEPFELEGKRLYGTGYAINHTTVPEGFYCYDLFDDGLDETAEHTFISRNPLQNNINGGIITDKPLDFHGENRMSIKDIKFLDKEPLVSLDMLLEQKTADYEISNVAGFDMVQK